MSENYEQLLRDSFDHWEYLYHHGGSDPFWADGTNLNLTRNRIVVCKRDIEEHMQLEDYPDIYYRETPPEVPLDYMARADEIRKSAKKSLEIYEQNQDLLYLRSMLLNLDPTDKFTSSVRNVIGYADGLRRAIMVDDLVVMRRHEVAERYTPSFAETADKVRALKPGDKKGQQNIFDVMLGGAQ